MAASKINYIGWTLDFHEMVFKRTHLETEKYPLVWQNNILFFIDHTEKHFDPLGTPSMARPFYLVSSDMNLIQKAFREFLDDFFEKEILNGDAI